MLTGFLILVLASLITCVCRQYSTLLRTRSRHGRLIKRQLESAISKSWKWQPGSESLDVSENHWVSDTVAAQRVPRTDMDSLYIGSFGGESTTFYSLHDMSQWFIESGVDPDDPVWDYLDALALEEVAND